MIELIKTTGPDKVIQPYTAKIKTPEMVTNASPYINLPIEKINGAPYKASICGFQVQSKDVNVLAQKATTLVDRLTSLARLPTYAFVARHAQHIYPVYTFEDEVIATTPGGPVFRHIELAKVREYLSDYLHDVGILGAGGSDDRLHVRGVNREDLSLKRPRFYFKKWIGNEADFWAPVFYSNDKSTIYTYAASALQETPVTDGSEVFALRDLTAVALKSDNRLSNLYDLRPDRLFAEDWEKLQKNLTYRDEIDVKGQNFKVYKTADNILVAAELRETEDRYNLYLGRADAELKESILGTKNRR